MVGIRGNPAQSLEVIECGAFGPEECFGGAVRRTKYLPGLYPVPILDMGMPRNV